jgi:hypothetical protein
MFWFSPTKHTVTLLSLWTIKPDICHKLLDNGELDYWYNAYTKMIIYDFALGLINGRYGSVIKSRLDLGVCCVVTKNFTLDAI